MKKLLSFILAIALLLTAFSAFAEDAGSTPPEAPPGGFDGGTPPGDPPGEPPEGFDGSNPPEPPDGFGGGASIAETASRVSKPQRRTTTATLCPFGWVTISSKTVLRPFIVSIPVCLVVLR